MSFQEMYGLRGPRCQTAVLQLTYELRPKWSKTNNKTNNNKTKTIAKMPFFGRTLCRGATNIDTVGSI